MEKTTFGERLRTAFNNATNAKIADKIGVGRSTVVNYLAGRIPEWEIVLRIQKVTGCDLHWLLTGENNTRRDAGTLEAPIADLLRKVASEQSHVLFSDAELGGKNLERKTLDLLANYLIARALRSLNLIDNETDVMPVADVKLAGRFTFIANVPQSLDERVGEIVEKKLSQNNVSSVAQREAFRDMISELVQEEIAKSRRKARLIEMDFGHSAEDEDDGELRKAS